jgi:hypothetical protein
MSPDERDALAEETEDVVEEVQDAFDEGETIREDVEYKNIDELLRLSFQVASNSYEDQVIDILGEYYLVGWVFRSSPYLTRQGNKLFVLVSGGLTQ